MRLRAVIFRFLHRHRRKANNYRDSKEGKAGPYLSPCRPADKTVMRDERQWKQYHPRLAQAGQQERRQRTAKQRTPASARLGPAPSQV